MGVGNDGVAVFTASLIEKVDFEVRVGDSSLISEMGKRRGFCC